MTNHKKVIDVTVSLCNGIPFFLASLFFLAVWFVSLVLIV